MGPLFYSTGMWSMGVGGSNVGLIAKLDPLLNVT